MALEEINGKGKKTLEKIVEAQVLSEEKISEDARETTVDDADDNQIDKDINENDETNNDDVKHSNE